MNTTIVIDGRFCEVTLEQATKLRDIDREISRLEAEVRVLKAEIDKDRLTL